MNRKANYVSCWSQNVTCDDGDSNDKEVGYMFIFICHQQFNMWMEIKKMGTLK